MEGLEWFRIGARTHEIMIEVSNFIHTIKKYKRLKFACPKESSFRKGFIDADQLLVLVNALTKNGYSQYLLQLLVTQIDL